MSFTLFNSLTFLSPWVLTGLLGLPVLWWILRVTPPAPKDIIFPPTRLLAELKSEDITPTHTPWWLLLLRIFIAGLVLTALSLPVLNANNALPGGKSAVLILIDNGWESADNHEKQIEAARQIVTGADRMQREIYILSTAPAPGENAVNLIGPLTGATAVAQLPGIVPQPWPADYKNAKKQLENIEENKALTSFWLSGGLSGPDADKLANALKARGDVYIYRPEDHALPVLLRPSRTHGGSTVLSAIIETLQKTPANIPVTVQALAEDGAVLDSVEIKTEKSGTAQDIHFDLPSPLKNRVTRLKLAGRQGAGSVLLLDSHFLRKKVGIVTAGGQDNATPFIESGYYLTRALEPYADIESGDLSSLLKTDPSVLVMADIATLPPTDLNQLESWVKSGGLLLRFAGPTMTTGETFLTPAPLRKGGRALDGDLTWDEPLSLSPFPEDSPYYGIAISGEDPVTVKRQILPLTDTTAAGHRDYNIWATLEDGTPLITAKALDNGLLVMVHTTASPLWSDLVLSGAFVQVLRRTVTMAGNPVSQQSTNGSLQPLITLDGFGQLRPPPASAEPVNAAEFDALVPLPAHPPGLYGRAGYQVALNLGDRLPPIKDMTAPSGTKTRSYGLEKETPLMPPLLYAAFILFLIDWLIMILMRTGRGVPLARKAGTVVILSAAMLLWTNGSTSAQTPSAISSQQVAYAKDLHLAYIKSGNASLDMTVRTGLENLMRELSRRTSVEPAGIVALNPEQDSLVFFPFIYWPVSESAPSLSAEALRKVQAYLDGGGTILLDTRAGPDNMGALTNEQDVLRTLLGGLNIPPLAPMPENHVLTKSFYLLKTMNGHYEDGTIWIDKAAADSRDEVSSIIIGSQDWATGWTGQISQQSLRLQKNTAPSEMAIRAGINFVMYALTGNYKADQVHLPHILERLGE